MHKREVFVIWTNPLFHEAVRLILQHPEVCIVGSSSEPEEAKQMIAALEPEIVLIEETGEQDSSETISILKTGPIVFRLGLADNELNIYRRQQQASANAEDLVRMILEGTSDSIK